MFSIKVKTSSVSAKLVSRNQTSCLWASFDASQPPTVWQLDLEKNPNFTLSLRETEGEWDLGYKAVDNDFVVIAHFDERGEAETAYEAVGKVLAKSVSGVRRFPLGRILLGLVFLIALFLAFDFFFKAGMTPSVGPEATAPVAAPAARPGEIQTGVPVNADDVLPQR